METWTQIIQNVQSSATENFFLLNRRRIILITFGRVMYDLCSEISNIQQIPDSIIVSKAKGCCTNDKVSTVSDHLGQDTLVPWQNFKTCSGGRLRLPRAGSLRTPIVIRCTACAEACLEIYRKRTKLSCLAKFLRS